MRDLLASRGAGARSVRREERGFRRAHGHVHAAWGLRDRQHGVVASIQAQSGTVRDQNTKSALTAAEAGVSQALLRYNGDFTPPVSQPCLLPNGSSWAPPPCRAPAPIPDGARRWRARWRGDFTYQVKPSAGTIEIVSNGSFNGVTRRVDVTAKSASGQQVFIDAGVKTQNGINLDANSEIHSGSATGGDIPCEQLEPVRTGQRRRRPPPDHRGERRLLPERRLHHAAHNSSVAQQDITLPPVNQGDAATNNDNARITNGVAERDPRRILSVGRRAT